jgi:hypothetical protein
MPSGHSSREPFLFWLANELLAADASAEGDYISDQIAVLTGSILFGVVFIVGFIMRGM